MVPVRARGVELQPLDIEIVQPDRQFMVFMDDVEVGADALVGTDGAGASVMFDALNSERLLVAAMALGLGEYALGKAVAYARERAPFGRPIGAYQAIQHRLARAKAHLEAARAVMYGAAKAFDRGEPAGPACNMAKLLASEAGVEACDAAIQVHGGYAFDAGYDVSTIWPLVRLFSIAPVNNEMVLNSIGEHVLGLPKSY
jgi:acyl-CoA dehydrogenase